MLYITIIAVAAALTAVAWAPVALTRMVLGWAVHTLGVRIPGEQARDKKKVRKRSRKTERIE